MWNISQHKISCPWPPTAPTGWQIHNTLAEPTSDRHSCCLELPDTLPFKWTHCQVFKYVLRDDSGFKSYPICTRCIWTHWHNGDTLIGLVTNVSGPNERTSLNLISRIWHKNIRWNSDTAAFNKNTFRYFCFMYTPNVWTFWTLLYSYVQVRYQCFHDYFNLYTGSPVTCRHSSEVPDDIPL